MQTIHPASAIAKAGNVVTAAQPYAGNRALCAPAFANHMKRSAGVGHVHVSTEADRSRGSFLVRQADDQGQPDGRGARNDSRREGANDRPFKSCLGQFHSGTHIFRAIQTRTMEIESGRPRSTQRLRAIWIPSNTSVQPVPLLPTHQL